MSEVKFELHRLTNYSDDDVLTEIRRVAALIKKPALTRNDFFIHSRIHPSTIEKRFGGWTNALEKAGIKERSASCAKTRKMADDEILNELKKFAKSINTETLSNTQLREQFPFSLNSLTRRFGSWQKAVEVAGLVPAIHSISGKRYSDDECFENLLRIWTHYGRPPLYKEMSIPPSQVGGKAYLLRFGSWNKTLKAFVDRVNLDKPDQPKSSTTEVRTENKFSGKIEIENKKFLRDRTNRSKNQQDDRRDISLGLRFKILNRDNFRCVLCGVSPATLVGCKLHVDHILPWSKGGKTTYENLRTLCADCNLGRGNRHIE